jgi:hypothetical protein
MATSNPLTGFLKSARSCGIRLTAAALSALVLFIAITTAVGSAFLRAPASSTVKLKGESVLALRVVPLLPVTRPPRFSHNKSIASMRTSEN